MDEKAFNYCSKVLKDLIADNNFYLQLQNKKLIIVYSQSYPYLGSTFKSDEELATYILKDVESAYYKGIERVSDNTFVLNIASKESLGYFFGKEGRWEYASLLNNMLTIFMPIIQKFMIEAVSGHIDASKFKKALLRDNTESRENQCD